MPKKDKTITQDPESNVTAEEKATLENIDYRKAESEDRPLIEGRLDDTDEDGDPLNEDSDDLSGEDLDVPGAGEDNEDEKIGEEDEENNEYSLNDDNGEVEEGQD